MRKHIAAAAMSASILTGAGAGALLFTPISAVAQEQGAEEAPQERAERGAWVDEALAGLVSDGTITAEQADAVRSALAEARPDRGLEGRGRGLQIAAETIGIEASDLMSQLRDGATVAEVAQANGVDPQAVIDAELAAIRTHLDEKVAEGELTQEEADERYAEATERVTQRVNEGRPEGGPRGPGGGEAPADD